MVISASDLAKARSPKHPNPNPNASPTRQGGSTIGSSGSGSGSATLSNTGSGSGSGSNSASNSNSNSNSNNRRNNSNKNNTNKNHNHHQRKVDESPTTNAPAPAPAPSQAQASAPAPAPAPSQAPSQAPKPFAPPPPRPNHQHTSATSQPGTNTPDYFPAPVGGSLSLEPNPFEQSFRVGGGPETPGGTKLPPVAALTSPSSLLPGSNGTPFNWGGGSLRTGPLSPAMLSGPANDYFSESHHLRGSFPTPNESSLRTGLTPGGSGSMFPAPSPNTQALFAQLANSSATPSTIDFHRAALSAATKREQSKVQVPQRPIPPPPPAGPSSSSSSSQQQQQQSQQQQQQQSHPPQSVTSQPQDMPTVTSVLKTEPKPAPGPFDPHDNDAANGLFMLAQGRNPSQAPASSNNNTYPIGTSSTAPGPSSSIPIAASSAPMPLPPPTHSSVVAPAPGLPNNMMSSRMAMPRPIGHHSSMSRGASEGSIVTDESDQTRAPAQARGRSRKNTAATASASASASASTAAVVNNARRKAADDALSRAPPNKKSRSNPGSSSLVGEDPDQDHSDFDDMVDDKGDDHDGKVKMTDEEKRKNFLERNRVAALKCRQRKKQWLQNLQNKVELYSSENDSLTSQITQLREEVVNLKTLLLAHKDCPVTQQQGIHNNYMAQVVEPFNPSMHPYTMGGPMTSQQVMAGQMVPRRLS